MTRYDDKNPTRKPLPPPFAVGTRLRCIDADDWRCHRMARPGIDRVDPEDDAHWITVYARGLEVTIVEARPGRQGSGRVIDHDDETGEPYLDATSDGYCVYRVEDHGRIIDRENAHNWEIVTPQKSGNAHFRKGRTHGR